MKINNKKIEEMVKNSSQPSQEEKSNVVRFLTNKSKQGVRATLEMFENDTKSTQVQLICSQLATLDPAAKDYQSRKTNLKAQLPLYAYCGYNEADNRSEEFVSNGNVIIDLDGLEKETLDNCTQLVKKWNVATKAQKLILLHLTPSSRGLRVVFRGNPQLDMVQNQLQFAKETGIAASLLDTAVKDFKRLSYIVPESYIYYINTDMLFGASGEPLKEYKQNAETTTAREVSSTNNNLLINILMTQDSKIEFNRELVDNYFNKHGYKRRQGQRHNADLEFGRTLKYYNVPENEIGEYYRYYVSKYAAEGILKGDDPIETREGYEAVLWGYNHNTAQDSEPEVCTTTPTNCAEHSSDAVAPFYHCSWQELENDFNNTAFLVDELEKIKLPKAVEATLKPIIEDEGKQMVAIPCFFSTYTTASTYMNHTSYITSPEGDEKRIALNTLISGGFASGKANVEKVVRLWANRLKQMTLQFNEAHKQWKKDVKKAEKNGEDFDFTEPINPTLFMGGDITEAAIKHILERSNGYRLLTYTSEVDSVGKNKSSFSLSTATLRRLYDSENLDYSRAGNSQNKVGEWDNEQTHIVPGLANYIYCGTPVAIAKFVPMESAEDGTASRQILCEIEDVVFGKKPQDYPFNHIDKLGVIDPVCNALFKWDGTMYVQELVELMYDWDAQWTDYARAINDVAVDKLKRRASELGLRIALTDYAIKAIEAGYTFSGGSYKKKGKTCAAPKVSEDTKNLFIFASNYIMMKQIKYYGSRVRDLSKKAVDYFTYSTSIAKGGYFDKLPEIFTTEDMAKYYTSKGSQKVARSKWRKHNMIKDLGDGRYQKI